MFLSSCEQFFNPDQELNITEDQLFDDWYEYRSQKWDYMVYSKNLLNNY